MHAPDAPRDEHNVMCPPACHEFMMRTPNRWVWFPFLTIKKLSLRTKNELAVLVARQDLGSGLPILHMNLVEVLFLTGEQKRLLIEQASRRTPADLVAEGWLVD